jgi:hypothetical protein
MVSCARIKTGQSSRPWPLPCRVSRSGISADGRTIVYHLRHGVQWQDGYPFTSADVVFSQRARLNPQNSVTLRAPYDAVVKLDTPDEFTVSSTLQSRSLPSSLSGFRTQSFPIDGRSVNTRVDAKRFARHRSQAAHRWSVADRGRNRCRLILGIDNKLDNTIIY